MDGYNYTVQNMNVSPYQQNIDIVKGFFKKPIVLVYGILSVIASLFSFCVSLYQTIMESSTGSSVANLYDSYGASSAFDTAITLPVSFFSLLFSVLLSICWITVYVQSKNNHPTKSPAGAISVLWVCSIVSLVALCLLSILVFLALFIISIASIFDQSFAEEIFGYDSPFTSISSATAFLFIMCIILAVMLVVIIVYSSTHIVYLASVRRSMRSIYLKRGGAMGYGVLSIIVAALSLVVAFAVFMTYIESEYIYAIRSLYLPYMSYMRTVYLLSAISYLISAVVSFLAGVIAVKYSNYIKGIVAGSNQSFNANHPYSNPVNIQEGNCYREPRQNNPNAAPSGGMPYTNPYANPQNINPQEPQQPVHQDNPYAQQSAPQPEQTNQAPVQPQGQPGEQPPVHNDNVCPKCGSKVFRSDIFCNNCGTKLK